MELSGSEDEVEGQSAALKAAEADLDRALGGRTEELAQKRDAAGGGPSRASGALPSARKKEAEQLRQGDACSTACAALSSMGRAAEHLCELASDADHRCEDARARVRSATERVRASCPACAAN
jgi:hypothetical protein